MRGALLRNSALSIDEGATATTTGATHLAFEDIDNTTSQISYVISSSTLRGGLKLNGTPLHAGNAFTQADLDSNLITYENNGGEFLTDSFSFTVSDGVGGEIGPTVFNINIVSVNDPPAVVAFSASNVVDADIGEAAYDFTVTFQDDSGIDVSTSDDSDIYITTPGALAIAATFISSVDTPGPRVSDERRPIGSCRPAVSGMLWIITTIGVNSDQVGDEDSTYVAANANIGASSVAIETTAPTVSSVSSAIPDGQFKAGDLIYVQVNFSEVVNVTGTPQITLETGALDAVVAYSAGSGSTGRAIPGSSRLGNT